MKAKQSSEEPTVEKPKRVRRVKAQVEPEENLSAVAEEAVEKPKKTRKPKSSESAEPKAPKPKKTCSAAQLEALAKGREALQQKRAAQKA